MSAVREFGVVIVGDEILCGKRTDRHLAHVIKVLQTRGMQVAWSRVVGDNRKRLVHELQSTQLDRLPVLCFGGIGATPDDRTRQAAAEAFGTGLMKHPGAVAVIEEEFGSDAYPNRIRMADLPEDCLLIPNPYNKIPGFTLYDHHFFPGFPSMAWPMLDWVLDHYYPGEALPDVEKSVRIFHVRESDLLRLMEDLSAVHPQVKLFSLPHLAAVNSIELGFRGEQTAVDAAFASLLTTLVKRAMTFEICQEEMAANGFSQTAV
jgi:molybdopterin-biosynthesis enzyme MoeA-like protein